jgi:hypothetical protein
MTDLANDQVMRLVNELQSNPAGFFSSHPHEGTFLEYKASFEYDAAMAFCPFVKADRNFLKNDALALRILETLTAFANTRGGLLIIGVAETNKSLANKKEKEKCRELMTGQKQAPCYMLEVDSGAMHIGELRISGVDKELETKGLDFDQFQRRLLERLSLASGNKKCLDFKPIIYPCLSPSKKAQIGPKIIRVWPSESIDLFIDDVFSVKLESADNSPITLCAVTVNPSPKPLTLKIEEDNSQVVKSVLPFRKSSKTQLEEDWQRMQAYIEKHFASTQLKDILLELSKQILMPALKKEEVNSNEDLQQLATDYASEWKEKDFTYATVESPGKLSKSHTRQVVPGDDEKHKNQLKKAGIIVFAIILLVIFFKSTGDKHTYNLGLSEDVEKFLQTAYTSRIADVAPAAAIAVMVQGKEGSGVAWQFLQNGQILSSEDNYRIMFYPESEAYFYIIQIDSTGKLDWLYPENDITKFSTGKNPSRAKVWTYVPGESLSFHLDKNSGIEHLYIVATKNQWKEIEELIRRGVMRKSQDMPVQKQFGLKTRGVAGIREISVPSSMTINSDQKFLQQLISGKDGILVYEVWFRHVEKDT